MTSLGGSSCGSAPNDAVRLEDFIGEWRDSLGNQVCVRWAQQGNPAGELDVQLLRPGSTSRSDRGRIHLNVKALGQGQFQCGHFEMQLDKSSVEKIAWGNMRVKGRVSMWVREEQGHRTRSRSRSRSHSHSLSQRPRKCGCVFMGKVALRCIEHLPPLPPRSVLHDVSTPEAWVPPAMAPMIVEKPSEADRPLAAELPQQQTHPAKAPQTAEKHSETDPLLEAYDQSLTQAATAAESPQQASPETLHEAKAKLLVKLFPAVGEAEAKLLVPEMLSNKQIRHSSIAPKGGSRDPRMRRAGVAPTGGA